MKTTETTTKTAQKLEHQLVDVKVEADLSGMIAHKRHMDTAELAKELDYAIKEFHAFLRDHRSQDMVRLDVARKYADLCSVCKEIWDVAHDEDGEYCGNCGTPVSGNMDLKRQ